MRKSRSTAPHENSKLSNKDQGRRRQNYVGPVQKAAGPAGDVDKAGGPSVRTVSQEKELALPEYGRKDPGCEIGDEGSSAP